MLKEIFSQRLKTQSKTVCNAIITLGDIDDSGKGKRFKSRFIQPGLVGHERYGIIFLRRETLDDSLNTIIGSPVIINHTNVTENNADDLRVGVISNAYYNEKDGWYWCEGVIWDETAQNLITDKKWSVSCSYDFLEQDDEGGTENNIPYDREFTKLNFKHLAIVDNPRYERANIVFNSKTVENSFLPDNQENYNPTGGNMLNNVENEKIVNGISNLIKNIKPSTLTNQDIKILYGLVKIFENNVTNGWITLRDKVDEEGNPLRVYIPDYIPQGGAATDFHHKMANEKSTDIKYEFQQTRAKISEEQKVYLKDKINKILSTYKIEPPLKGVNVCTIGQGCLGVAIVSKNTRTLSLDSKCFKENGSEAFNKSVESGWLARTDKDIITSVLTHELGHTITSQVKDETFWNKIQNIKTEYIKNIKEDDIKNKDFVSKYARKSKDEFVAECFAQATLLKKPSKYAIMVLDEINRHFKLGEKEYKQMRLFNAVMEVLNMKYNEVIQNSKETQDEILWVEGNGIGYCLTEEDYNKREQEVKQHEKEETKK